MADSRIVCRTSAANELPEPVGMPGFHNGVCLMDRTAFFALLDELFELDEGTVNGSSVLKETPGWSSLTFVGLIALVDEEFGVTLSPNGILGCETVSQLADLLESALSTSKAA